MRILANIISFASFRSVCRLLILCIFLRSLGSANGVSIPMKYEGGSLPFKQHAKLRVSVGGIIAITQNNRTFSIEPGAITEVSYGNDIHRRVGVAFVTGSLMLLLLKTKKHYVGITWNGVDPNGVAARGGAVFKVGKGEYRGLIAALEGLTGRKAVNADVAPSDRR